MALRKDSSSLVNHFPYLSEELAEAITKKLTGEELRQLRREFKETCEASIRSTCQHLLTLTQQKRNDYILNVAAEKPATV